METGELQFTDVTSAYSLGEGLLTAPTAAFAAAVSDLNNDGFTDLVVFNRPSGDCSEYTEAEEGLAEFGHAIFINHNGEGFVEVTSHTGLNDPFEMISGVMGASVMDLDADGIPDVFIGNGGPAIGQHDQLFLSAGLQTVEIEGVGDVVVPVYDNMTHLINFPVEEVEGRFYPPYPYRTHGTCITDFDGDGLPELAVTNGGPEFMPDFVQEPNRLFQLTYANGAPNWLKIRVEGDGESVHRDAFHTRLAVTVENEAGESWTVREVYFASNGFSVQHGRDVFFGLRDGQTITQIEVIWPNQEIEILTDVTEVNQHLHLVYGD
jgi:hypothetical protein